ncbi:MAG: hypothetical protein KDD83_30130, partial [Caldilineaceae bacterium]|nr:hypothetical protein [Caldilineaceae bacterium]
IPDGGDFRVSFRVPIDASTDEHIVEVCAAERSQSGELVCTAGEFAQRTETLFMVEGPTLDPPALSTDPTSAKAGALITLIGANFTPGDYEGLVFWDGNGMDRLKIPAGGAFNATVRVPVDAFVGEHSISVCAAESDAGGNLTCITGSFEQRAETLFVVDAATPIRVCKEEVDPCSPFSKATV